MQIDPAGDRHWFPILEPLPGETYAERLTRSETAYREEKQRTRDAADRMQARASGQRARTPLGHSGNCGHRRHTVKRPATAGKW